MSITELELTNLLKSIKSSAAREVVLSYEGDQEDYDHFVNIICTGLSETIYQITTVKELPINKEFLEVALQFYSLDSYPPIYNTKTAKLITRRLKQLKDFQSFSKQNHKVTSIKLVYSTKGDDPAFNNSNSVTFDDEDFHEIFISYLERLESLVEAKIEGHQKVIEYEKAITKLRRQRDNIIRKLYIYLYKFISSESQRKQAKSLAQIINAYIKDKDKSKETFSGKLEEHCRNNIKHVGMLRKK